MDRINFTAFPPKVRAGIYWTYAVTGVILGSIQVGFAAISIAFPVWLVVALAVYAYLGVAFGLTAASNTPLEEDEEIPSLEDGDYEPQRTV